jgi:hypothetical protein
MRDGGLQKCDSTLFLGQGAGELVRGIVGIHDQVAALDIGFAAPGARNG